MVLAVRYTVYVIGPGETMQHTHPDSLNLVVRIPTVESRAGYCMNMTIKGGEDVSPKQHNRMDDF